MDKGCASTVGLQHPCSMALDAVIPRAGVEEEKQHRSKTSRDSKGEDLRDSKEVIKPNSATLEPKTEQPVTHMSMKWRCPCRGVAGDPSAKGGSRSTRYWISLQAEHRELWGLEVSRAVSISILSSKV